MCIYIHVRCLWIKAMKLKISCQFSYWHKILFKKSRNFIEYFPLSTNGLNIFPRYNLTCLYKIEDQSSESVQIIQALLLVKILHASSLWTLSLYRAISANSDASAHEKCVDVIISEAVRSWMHVGVNNIDVYYKKV